MCGIAGIVCRLEASSDRTKPHVERLKQLAASLVPGQGLEAHGDVISEMETVAAQLRREVSFWQIATAPELAASLADTASRVEMLEDDGKRSLGPAVSSHDREQWNALWIRLRDMAWLIREDVLGALDRIGELMGSRVMENRHLFHHGWKLAATLSSLGRLEVRGRDSLGISALLTFPASASQEAWNRIHADEIARRRSLKDFTNGAVLASGLHLNFTFKVAEEVGALGDNVARLQSDICNDRLFLSALSLAGVESNFFGHTRWASNGIINEPNCHPVNHLTLGAGEVKSYSICAALNGDIDNYQELRSHYQQDTGRRISDSITTDTKIIPVMVSYYYDRCGDLQEAFRQAVNDFEGSLAIAMHSSLDPDRLYLALLGSGQSLCVGLTDDGYVVASELYGVVEKTNRFVRMDGTRERVAGRPETRGQIFVVEQGKLGLEGLQAMSFDGVPLDVSEEDVLQSEITTRDINRAGFKHYLLKEITESPQSIQRTLAGKFSLSPDRQQVEWQLDEDTVPRRVVEGLRQEQIRHIVIIGQGTAGVAGDAMSAYMRRLLRPSGVAVEAIRATELSGYHLADDLTHTLIIAVSQSGTTTDTNRTIDLVRSRGALVIGIVNRRNSDLVYKVDGVLYTSDGRDIEMSVASTKAFYSQVVAGYLLALYFSHELQTLPAHAIATELSELSALPRLMERVLQRKSEIEASARAHAPVRRDWALAGSGFNRAAADEIRIKLSELCYKSIASDGIEDKKHIDLSSEPLVLICAAGLPAVALKDAVKEVAIFKSHKSCPIVFASEGAIGFEPYAAGLLRVPAASESISVMLNTLVGHLWGYYAANAIDDGAASLRRARALVVKNSMAAENGKAPAAWLDHLQVMARQILGDLQSGRFNSSMGTDTGGKLSLLLQYLTGRLPLSAYAEDFAQSATPANLYRTVIQGLSQAIQELSRPIDAIKHQAKTITVGISRLEEKISGALFDGLAEAGLDLETVSYKDLMLLKAVAPAIESVLGTTRYRVTRLGELGQPTEATRIVVETRTGIAAGLSSRTTSNPFLTGAKSWVVGQRTAYVGVGQSDGRPIVILPLFSQGVCDQLILLHVAYVDTMPSEEKRSLLEQVHHRYDDLRAQVTEANLPWKDDYLEAFSPRQLATASLDELTRIIAERAAQPAVDDFKPVTAREG